MSGYDVAAMSACYALIGAVAWLLFTGDFRPLLAAVAVAAVVALVCHFAVEDSRP